MKNAFATISNFDPLAKAALLLACVVSSVGCQNWPQSKRMMQQQIESERLLSEYRAQKKRADELESRNKQLSERLSESEKMLARLQATPNNSRVARGSEPSFSGAGYQSGSVEQYASEFKNQISDSSTGGSSRNTSARSSDQPTWRPITRQ